MSEQQQPEGKNKSGGFQGMLEALIAAMQQVRLRSNLSHNEQLEEHASRVIKQAKAEAGRRNSDN